MADHCFTSEELIEEQLQIVKSEETPGKLYGKPRRSFPLWLTAALVIAWLLSAVLSVGSVQDAPLASWAAWRLSDQELRLATDDTRPAALLRRAELLERDPDPRSQAGAAILWYLAGQPEKARAIPLGSTEDPERDELVRAMIAGRAADGDKLESWASWSEGAERYWWEERLILDLAGAGTDLHSRVAGLLESRRQRTLLVGWVVGISSLLLMVAGLIVAVRVFRRRPKGLRLDRVPPIFRWIGWRRVMAGVAAAELGALLLLTISSIALSFHLNWTHGQMALHDSLWRGAGSVILCLLFFPGVRKAMRAIRLDLRFTAGPVFAALGLSLAVAMLCDWLLPRGAEHSQGVMVNPWTFGGNGLAYILWSGCVVAPLFEEIVHRGFIFNALASRFGTVAGVLVSSTIFSAIHGYPLQGSVSVFGFGVISALLYRATGSLGASVLLHSASNFSSLLGYWLAMESPYY